MARKRELRDFREACRQSGLDPAQRIRASKALHEEKASVGQPDRDWAELLVWVEEWKEGES